MGALMLQGTGSDVGKSALVAGLGPALTNRGMILRPFKPQNMSNNAHHRTGSIAATLERVPDMDAFIARETKTA